MGAYVAVVNVRINKKQVEGARFNNAGGAVFESVGEGDTPSSALENALRNQIEQAELPDTSKLTLGSE